MKLLVAVITFAATLGVLFLIENTKTPRQDYAQIIEALKNGNAGSATTPAIPTPAKTAGQSPLPPQNSPSLSKTPIPASTTPPPSQTLASTATPALTPVPTQEAQQGSISVVSLTSPVQQNSTAQLTIATLSAAQCSIKVTLPSGNQSSAKGLETKISDISGSITWSWKINWNTTPGTAAIEINCSKGGQNFSKSLQMVITER